MITLVYSIYPFGIGGMEPWLLFWAASLVLYFAIFLIFKRNRSKNGIKNIVLGFIFSEIIFDIIWAVMYYFNGWYMEYLVGVTYGFFMWIAFLILAGTLLTVKNYKRR